MSFKSFSTSHVNSSKDKPETKIKAAPTTEAATEQPAKKQDAAAPSPKP
jgi:hypothetical protein